MEWKYFKKDGRVVGKWQPSEERVQEYLDNGYEECEKDGCDCISGSVVCCDESKPKTRRRPPKRKKSAK